MFLWSFSCKTHFFSTGFLSLGLLTSSLYIYFLRSKEIELNGVEEIVRFSFIFYMEISLIFKY